MRSVNGRTHFDRSTRPNSFHCVKCLYVNLGLSVTLIEKITRKNRKIVWGWIKPYKRQFKNKPGIKHGNSPARGKIARAKAASKRAERLNRMDAKRSAKYIRAMLRVSKQVFIYDKNRRRYVRRIRLALWRIVNGTATHRAQEICGCSHAQLVAHLQARFSRGMAWNNYGKFWEVDHIIPCMAFDILDKQQRDKCFHYSNLQPLTVSANRRKWANIQPTQQELGL